ncbi:branched-chain amino acid transport system II carrier protein [Vagococcus penaei]|nr:branched-chain amino acid transport system II carrier protein [Vagococcus penaei]
MKLKLTMKERLYIGMMVFGLFFGAGNLIFPIQIGQEAGANVLLANMGFLVTGIGLPFLGIVAFGTSDSESLMDLGNRVGPRYAKILTTILYLIIGPLFALPRLATTSFEVGFAPFVKSDYQIISLLAFTLIFFSVVWFFSRKPSRILDYIGKFLTPLFLILLAIILLFAFLKPMGSITHASIQGGYQNHAFLTGFTAGYNTLDALAALAFGTIIVDSMKSLGIKQPKYIALELSKAGMIGIVIMGVLYTLLSLTGTMSLGEFSVNANGGITLAQISHYYLGNFGSFLLAIIVLIACVKTAIGLSTAFAKTFDLLYPKVNYVTFVVIALTSSFIISNFGLTRLIAISIPVLMFIYPLAMTLILMSLGAHIFDRRPVIYRTVTLFTLVASSIDCINALPKTFIQRYPILMNILSFADHYLPLFRLGLSWVPFACLGLLVGLIISHYQLKKDA